MDGARDCSEMAGAAHVNEYAALWRVAYNLQLDDLALNLHRPDFLRNQTRSVSKAPRGAWLAVALTKSTPMVEMYVSVYVSSANRRSRHDLPTPESPMSKSLKR